MLPRLLEQMNDLVPAEFNTAYEKVLAAHQKEQKNQIDYLQKMGSIIATWTPASQEQHKNLLSIVVQAILESQTLEVVYHTKSRDVVTSRLIDPIIDSRENRFYLIAYCYEKQKFLTFRMSRFLEVKQTEKMSEKMEFNIKDFFKHTWSIIQGSDEIHFKVLFSKNVARYIMEEELFVSPKLTKNEDGSLLFEVTLNHDREFLQWIMQYGPDAEIIEPIEYRRKMKELLEEWSKKY